MIVLVPSTLSLLPAYAGEVDSVPELRSACHEAVAALVVSSPARVRVVAAPARADNAARGVGDPAGDRVGRALLEAVGFEGHVADAPGCGVLVVASGSARRSEKAPGHFDPRAEAFDRALGAAVRNGDGARLRELDDHLAADLWCHDVPALRVLGDLVEGRAARVSYDDAPFGVQYWVASWR